MKVRELRSAPQIHNIKSQIYPIHTRMVSLVSFHLWDIQLLHHFMNVLVSVVTEIHIWTNQHNTLSKKKNQRHQQLLKALSASMTIHEPFLCGPPPKLTGHARQVTFQPVTTSLFFFIIFCKPINKPRSYAGACTTSKSQWRSILSTIILWLPIVRAELACIWSVALLE